MYNVRIPVIPQLKQRSSFTKGFAQAVGFRDLSPFAGEDGCLGRPELACALAEVEARKGCSGFVFLFFCSSLLGFAPVVGFSMIFAARFGLFLLIFAVCCSA